LGFEHSNPELVHTKHGSVEDELVPPTFVVFEYSDMDYTQDKVENEKDGRDWHVRYDLWNSAQPRDPRRIWRVFGLRWCQLREHDEAGPCAAFTCAAF
jgi:hypothetical protein